MRAKLKFGQSVFTWFIFLMPLSLLVFIDFPSYDGFSRSAVDSYLLVLARASGLYAVFLLLWQQILGNRYIVKNFTSDLSWSTSLHKKIGIYSILLFLLHPLLSAYSYGWDLLSKLNLDLSNEFEKHVAMGRMALIVFLIIWVSSAILRGKLAYRPWKYLHYLTYLILPFVLLHASELGQTLGSSEPARLVWSIVVAVFIWAITVRLIHFFGFGQSKYKLIAKTELSPGIFRYTLEPLKGAMQPKPGQFIYFRKSTFSEEHPFTVADYDKDSGNVFVISKVFGKYTSKLSKLKIDSTIMLDGPYGSFTGELEEKRPSVLIAGGIGITPFLRHAFSAKNKHLFLFNCNRNLESAVLRKELKKSLGSRYVDVTSENSKGKNVETGYISPEIISKYISKKLDKLDFYICGPPAMMQAAAEGLIDAGVPKENIYTENFSF